MKEKAIEVDILSMLLMKEFFKNAGINLQNALYKKKDRFTSYYFKTDEIISQTELTHIEKILENFLKTGYLIHPPIVDEPRSFMLIMGEEK